MASGGFMAKRKITRLTAADRPKRIAKIYQLRDQGLNDSQIAAQLGITIFAFSHFQKRHGLPPNPHQANHKGRKPSPQVAKAVQLHLGGMDKNEAAKQCGVHPASIVWQLRKRERERGN